MALACFVLYLRLAPRDAVKAAAVLLVMCLFAYYVAGAGSLLLSVLVAIDSTLIRRRTLVGLTALLCGLGVPWLMGKTLFHLSLSQAYGNPSWSRTRKLYCGIGVTPSCCTFPSFKRTVFSWN